MAAHCLYFLKWNLVYQYLWGKTNDEYDFFVKCVEILEEEVVQESVEIALT